MNARTKKRIRIYDEGIELVCPCCRGKSLHVDMYPGFGEQRIWCNECDLAFGVEPESVDAIWKAVRGEAVS